MCLKVWSPPSVVAEWVRGTVVPLISTLALYRSAMDLSWLYRLGLIFLARSREALKSSALVDSRWSPAQLSDLVEKRRLARNTLHGHLVSEP